jgi:3-deoxy-D-manno-octulosonate 8-phosphate phosphatase (KDO 8-P phosphatase)
MSMVTGDRIHFSPTPAEVRTRVAKLRLLCLDVDGVLTDGNLYWSEDGQGRGVFWQRFNVRDGYGLRLLQELGVELAILSGGDVRSARDRAAHLGIKHAYFGLTDKVSVWRDVASIVGVSLAETGFIGDELVDIPLLEQVGFAATVPDAADEVRRVVHYVTRARGGEGAVREVCDLIRAERAVLPPR